MQYRVMATILETVDNPEDALPECRVCIDQLHSLPGVQKSFKVELKKGFLSRLSEDERGQNISTVCHVNRVVYNVLRMVARSGELLTLPRLNFGKVKSIRSVTKELLKHYESKVWSIASFLGHLVRRVNWSTSH